MEQERLFRVNAYIVSTDHDLVDKWFTYYDDAESYFDEHAEIFKSDHQGRNVILRLCDGDRTYKNEEFNKPEDEDEIEEDGIL